MNWSIGDEFKVKDIYYKSCYDHGGHWNFNSNDIYKVLQMSDAKYAGGVCLTVYGRNGVIARILPCYVDLVNTDPKLPDWF